MRTASQMGSLAGKAGSSGLLPTRSRGVLGVGRFTPVLLDITICPARVHVVRVLSDVGRVTIIGIGRAMFEVHVHFVIYPTGRTEGEKKRDKKEERSKGREIFSSQPNYNSKIQTNGVQKRLLASISISKSGGGDWHPRARNGQVSTWLQRDLRDLKIDRELTRILCQAPSPNM